MLKHATSLLTTFLFIGFFLMIAAHVASPVMEGDPDFNCYAHGNRVCGEPESEAKAWEVWDRTHQSERLGTECAHRVEYVGVALIEPAPHEGWVTVSWEDGKRYVFRTECL